MKGDWIYRRGDVYLANLDPYIGSEQGGTRPVVVLQNNTGNFYCPTLIVAPITSKENKGHWRCKTVAFRVSPEEGYTLDMKVNTSGLLKQDYITKKVLDEEIVVKPNSRIQKYLAGYLTELTNEFRRHEKVESDSYVLENIRYLLELIVRLNPETRT